MDANPAPKEAPPPPQRDQRSTSLPHIHSTHHPDVSQGQGHRQGQVQGPWRRYQLRVNDEAKPELSVVSDADVATTSRSALDPAIRAGCVPATAYPSFRTIPPSSSTAEPQPRRLPRVTLYTVTLFSEF